MKKIIYICLLGSLGFTSMAFAKGRYQQGFVNISNYTDGRVHLLASFNNRYNTIEYGSPTQLMALPSPNKGPAVFYATDSNNTTFMCLVSPGSSYYDFAQQVAMNLHSGTMVSLVRQSDSTECSYVGLVNSSSLLD